MRICILTRLSIEPGSDGTYYYRTKYLSQHNDVFIIIPQGRRISEDIKNAKIYRIACPKTIIGYWIFAILAFLKVIMLHHQYKFEVIYPMCPLSTIIALLMRLNTRTLWLSDVVTLPAQGVEFTKFYSSRFLRLIYYFVFKAIDIAFRIILKKADITIALSRGIKTDLVTNYGCNPKEVFVSSDGVDLQNFKPSTTREASNNFKLVYIGAINSFRGIDTIIYALRQVVNDIPDFKLILAGFGPDNDIKELKGLIQKLNLESRVDWKGKIPHKEIPKLLDECHVALSILPPLESYKVSSPLKIFEYLAMNKVVIVSDILAHRNIIKDGKNGLLVKPEDPDDLAKAITNVYSDKQLREILMSNARKSVEIYDWEKLNERIEAKIKEKSEDKHR